MTCFLECFALDSLLNTVDSGPIGVLTCMQIPIASRAASTHIDAKQLLRRVKLDTEPNAAVRTLQEQLHRWSNAYSKVTLTGKALKFRSA